MIIFFGLLIVAVVVGSVQLTFKVIDYIEKKFNKNIDDASPYVILVLIVEVLILLQVLYDMKLIH